MKCYQIEQPIKEASSKNAKCEGKRIKGQKEQSKESY